MRQVCNVAYAQIANSFVDEDELRAWEAELPQKPDPNGRSRRPAAAGPTKQYLDLMTPPGGVAVANA